MKIVFILSRFPYPLEKGDKLRAFQHLQNMHASGHEVHLVALTDRKVTSASFDAVNKFSSSIEVLKLSYFRIFMNILASFFRGLPLQVGYFYSSQHQLTTNRLLRQLNPDLVYCQLIRTARYVKHIKTTPRVIDYQDAFSKGTRQRMEKAPWFLKPLFARELQLVTDFEQRSYQWFNSHLIISEQDRSALSIPMNKMVFIVPNGIDFTFFSPVISEKKTDVAFVGNMNYPPNVDGAHFLIEEIMPVVWKKFPGAKVMIAGANPRKSVRDLASPNVTVTGWMEDIRECYKATKVFTAPMRIGTGLQNKLLEAMAMGIPCVTTPLSLEPLGATDGVDLFSGTLAGDLAERIITLLQNENLREQIGQNGRNFVMKNYSMENTRLLLNNVFDIALQKTEQ